MHATREHILASTPIVFAELGFDGASTRRLAAAANVNVATLAYHFGDKQGLYEAVIDHVYGRLLEYEVPALGAGPLEERIHRLVHAIYEAARQERDGIRLLLRHVMVHGRLPSSVRERWSPQIYARVQSTLAALEIDAESLNPLGLLSLNHLIARYVVSDPRDVAPFTTGSDTQAAIVAHLTDLAKTLLIRT